MIVSILAERPRRPALADLTQISGVPIIDLDARSLNADFVIGCADGTQIALVALTTMDLLHQLRQKELFANLAAAKARWPWTYLLVLDSYQSNSDGKLKNADGTVTGWSFDAFQGALLTAQEMGVLTVSIRHHSQFADTVQRLAARERGPVKLHPVREALFYTPEELLLLALPGIGDTMAEKLLSYCGDVSGVLMALTDDSISVPGIGPKTREAVRKALGLKPYQALGKYRPEPEEAAKAA